MDTKEYYQALMAVIEYVGKGHREISCDKGTELAGNYWPRICQLLRNEKIATIFASGDLCITRPQYLNPIHADCIHAIAEIAKKDADRDLDNKAKESNMRYARRAFWISIGALIVAATSLVWQIIQATA